MDILGVIKTRRSIREFSDRPIAGELIEKIIDAARFAPTARNIQPWEFVAVTEPGTLNKIADITEHGKFIAQAKCCIVVFSSDTKYYLEDGCAATQNILLAATSLGIGSCWVAGDKKAYSGQIAGLLNAPGSFKLVSLIALGYPVSEDSFKVAEKRPFKELIHREKF
ncbi:MAG: nitroreductase family protein [Candidatus Omnitrophota bacterium]|nr:nitroreductase family protein [Candidatus Omnitrophota bacterium]MBU1928943.1 nitroreductase family protein [Candidatus Omnitrophota bacterium]MBU2034977.1 nitroreductase family protein [Candidatus Omnitrophota bacterium]MBU2221052.1 nitroreductase family protein [Candidatus Omnitrophota bacterium]MBU2257930.1 nitroreductase family protein [Candidatus Omnitrophota bacterium]